VAVEQTPASTSASVVRTYFAIAGGYTLAASLIWGINTLFLLDAGLDVLGVFIVNAAFTAGMVLFEIPTGVVADTLGRRISFLASIAVLVVATLAYVLTAEAEGGVVPFAIVSVLLGLGFTFYSGAVEAWLVDALRAVGYEGALDRVFARGQQVTGAAMLVGTVGGGLLGQIDLAIPYIVRICLLVALFLLAFGRMHEIGFTPRQLAPDEVTGAMKEVARAGVTYGWRQPSIRLLMIASAIQGAFTTFVFFAWQPYLLELLDRDAVWVAGVVSSGIALAMIAGNQLVT
jgi:MFS family permease